MAGRQTTITAKARRLLLSLGATEEAASLMTKRTALAADELRKVGYAIFVDNSRGPPTVALTSSGIDEYDRLRPPALDLTVRMKESSSLHFLTLDTSDSTMEDGHPLTAGALLGFTASVER